MGKITDIVTQFTTRELVKVSHELNLEASMGDDPKALAKQLIKDINENGVPVEGASDLMLQFLYVAQYVDDKGKLLGEEVKETKPVEAPKPEAKPVEEVQEEKKPQCYSYADDADPSCQKCKVLKLCTKARIAARPDCFGQYFSGHAPECQVCLEAALCKPVTQQVTNNKKSK